MNINTFLSKLTNSSIPEKNTVGIELIHKFKKNKPSFKVKLDHCLFENKQYNRLLVIGDIHGAFDKAISALQNANITENDFLITLGDYTDRGNQNTLCEKLILTFKNYDNIISLMGNHELMLLEYFLIVSQKVLGKAIDPMDLDTLPIDDWHKIVDEMQHGYYGGGIYSFNGGYATLNEINDNNINLFKDYLQLIYNLPLKLDIELPTQNYIFAHAGIHPFKDIEEQTIDDFLWIREKFFNNYTGDATVVVGHTRTQYLFNDNVPHWIDNIIYTDTGSFTPDGKVTVVDLLSDQYWQND